MSWWQATLPRNLIYRARNKNGLLPIQRWAWRDYVARIRRWWCCELAECWRNHRRRRCVWCRDSCWWAERTAPGPVWGSSTATEPSLLAWTYLSSAQEIVQLSQEQFEKRTRKDQYLKHLSIFRTFTTKAGKFLGIHDTTQQLECRLMKVYKRDT